MLGIYIHIPFCKKKCLYCDFTSFENVDFSKEYFDALKEEIRLSSQINKYKVNTIFIGGGTPSFVSEKLINELLECIYKHFSIFEKNEITIETNPNSLSISKLKEYKKSGINRLSIGLQSTQNELLKFIGRQHTIEDFQKSYENARNVGFKNINLDLMYSLPYQTIKNFFETLNYVVDLAPEHISVYSLKLEDGTPLYNMYEANQFKKADEDMELRMYHLAQNLLAANGYTNYEISNFAKKDFECQHNLKYWNLRDYLGIGVSAASNIGNLRFTHGNDIKKYVSDLNLSKLTYDDNEILSNSQREYEYIMLKTRLKSGIDFLEYTKLFNADFLTKYSEQINNAEQFGLIKITSKGICPTNKGFDLQNKLVLLLSETL